MIRCPICQRALNPFGNHPHAPICSEACRKEALRRAGIPDPEGERGAEDSADAPAQFEQLRATHLYCQTCRRSMPTRERLLLVIPGGNLYGYFCAQCGADVGSRTDTSHHPG